MPYTILSLTAIAALSAVFSLYFFIKRSNAKDWVHAIYFVTVFVVGAALYLLGLSYNGYPDNTGLTLFTVATAICLALKSFCWDFGAASVSKLAQANAVFAAAMFAHFIAAIMFTFLMAIVLFGKNAKNKIRVFINKYFRPKYIVVGTSKHAEVFLRSLSDKKRKLTTVVLESARREKKNDLMNSGFAVVVIKDGEENFDDRTYDALKLAGFHHNKRRTTIISMSEDDAVNLLAAKIATDHIAGIVNPEKDDRERVKKLTPEKEKKLGKLNLSVYAMYEILECTEHFAFSEYALGRVRFFNPYELCARKFIRERPITSLIPKDWINTKKARLYNESDEGHGKPYRIMNFFVGYGRTNRQLLKKSVCNYQLLGADYNALIIDKNAKGLGKYFQNAAPGLFNGAELNPDSDYYPNPKEAYNIAFDESDVLSSDFYNKIIKEINGYGDKDGYDFATVVIALGTDILNIETALELRQKLYERKLLKGTRGDMEYARVRIFVKISKDILKYHDILNDRNDINNEIIVFGVSDEILNESYIIDEKMDFIAKRLANNYWETAGKDAQRTNVVTKWDSLTEFKRESNRGAALSIRTKLNLLGFELKECADKADNENVRKAYDEAYGIAVSKKQRSEKKSGKFVDFAERGENGGIMDNARNNLARLEHQRWNTMHLVSGWTKLEIAEVTAQIRQDEKSKQHACITTFEGLSDLRKRQADDALAEAKKSGNSLSDDNALSDADTVCYDFDLMDLLFENLYESDYCVMLRK